MEAFVIVEVAPHKVALPAHEVEQVLRMVALTPAPQAPDRLDGILDLHGELIPVISARAWLGLPRRDPHPDARLVIVRARGDRVALHVDRVVDLAVVEPECVVATSWAGPLLRTALRLSDGVAMIAPLEALSGDDTTSTPPTT